jgi:hypothetical protein
MNGRTLTRLGGTAAALVVLTAAAGDRAPAYYSHAEYYSDATYSVQVGGWLSCPPGEQGGYSRWGTTTSPYYIYTTDDYYACEVAE